MGRRGEERGRNQRGGEVGMRAQVSETEYKIRKEERVGGREGGGRKGEGREREGRERGRERRNATRQSTNKRNRENEHVKKDTTQKTNLQCGRVFVIVIFFRKLLIIILHTGECHVMKCTADAHNSLH